jgi:hypothetical protein
MLVAMGVVALLGLLIAQITVSSQRVIRSSNSRMDAEGQAGLVIDRLSTDLGSLVERADVDFAAANTGPGGNARIRLVISIPAAGDPAGGNRNISLLALEIAGRPETDERPCLVRAAKPLGWEEAHFLGLNAQGLPPSLADTSFPSAPASPDYDVLAEGVFRLVVGFQLRPDNRPVTLLNGLKLPHAAGQLVYSPPVRLLPDGLASTSVDSSRVAALVFGLVALDVPNHRQLSQAELSELSAAFPLPAQNQYPGESWLPIARNLAGTGSPATLRARQAVRVYERAFALEGRGRL